MKTMLCVVVCGFVLIPRSADAQCTKDTDCKGDRICVNGTCSSPAVVPAPVPDAGTAPHPNPPPLSPVPPHRPAGPRRRPGLFALELGLGVSGCTGDCRDVGFKPMVGQRVAALFRLGRYFELGLHVDTMMLELEGADTTFALMIAPEARVVVPVHPRLEIWGALAGGYINHYIKGPRGTVFSHGFGLGFGAGVQFYVIPRIAIGASVWFYAPFFNEQCFDTVDTDGCYDIDIDNPAEQYGLFWMVGPHVTFYFGR